MDSYRIHNRSEPFYPIRTTSADKKVFELIDQLYRTQGKSFEYGITVTELISWGKKHGFASDEMIRGLVNLRDNNVIALHTNLIRINCLERFSKNPAVKGKEERQWKAKPQIENARRPKSSQFFRISIAFLSYFLFSLLFSELLLAARSCRTLESKSTLNRQK
jgi:hypothetical protein